VLSARSSPRLAVSYHHVWFSQDARGYTMLLTWTLVASWLLVSALERNTRKLWVGYAVVAALGTYTHLTMLFVVAAHCLIYAWTEFKRRELPVAARADGLLFGFGLAGLLTVQFYALVLPQLFAGTLREGTSGEIKTWSSPLWAALELLRGMGLAYHHVAVFAVVGTLVAIGCVGLLRECPMPLALTVLPVAICAAVVLGSGHHVWPRFLFFASGLAILVLTAGVMTAGRWASARFLPRVDPRLSATLFVSVLVVVSATAVPAAYGPKQDYAGARDLVQSSRRVGDRVAVVGAARWPYQHFYHLDWTAVEDPVGLDRVRDGARRVWLVYTFPVEFDELFTDLSPIVRRDFQVIGRFRGTLNGGDVVVTRSIEVLNGRGG
jgi:mannosyltransferase